MASLNKVMLMGNLTRDPEVRYTPKGQAVTDVALAINRRYKVENETREEVTYVDVTFWGKQAETIGQYMKKGRPLYVEGRLQLDTWDDKATGQKRSRLKIIGDEFQFLGGREGGGGGGSGGGGGGGDYGDEGGGPPPQRGNSSSGGGGYSSNQPRQQSRPPQQDSRPPADSFPPGLDDDEIPF